MLKDDRTQTVKGQASLETRGEDGIWVWGRKEEPILTGTTLKDLLLN